MIQKYLQGGLCITGGNKPKTFLLRTQKLVDKTGFYPYSGKYPFVIMVVTSPGQDIYIHYLLLQGSITIVMQLLPGFIGITGLQGKP